jgi:hypothetical protein
MLLVVFLQRISQSDCDLTESSIGSVT